MPIDRQVCAFCASRPRIGTCKAFNIWLAEAFDLYARPIKYRLNFNAREPNICGLYTWMRSRDIEVYDTTRNRRTYSYTREHGHMRARTYLVDSLPTYPPTNLPAATQYGTRDAIYEGWMRYARTWKMIVVIALPAFGTSFRSFPTRSIDTIRHRIVGICLRMHLRA